MSHPGRENAAPAPYAIVLAAGAGVRFGGAKLLAPFQGRPLVSHAATTVAEAIAAGLLAGGVAIVPPGDTILALHLESAGLRVVANPETASGLASSLKLGLVALEQWPATPEPRAALIVLADQPLLAREVIAQLVVAWKLEGRTVRPRYARHLDKPGHPVLLDRGLWPEARRLTGDRGLGALLRENPDMVRLIDVPGANPDVDTPDELNDLEADSSL